MKAKHYSHLRQYKNSRQRFHTSRTVEVRCTGKRDRQTPAGLPSVMSGCEEARMAGAHVGASIDEKKTKGKAGALGGCSGAPVLKAA